MRIAVVGKGGAGKTTVAGSVARLMAKAGNSVLAIDADTNPMLGIQLGLGVRRSDTVIPLSRSVDRNWFEPEFHALQHEHSVEGMIGTFGVDTSDGVRLLVLNKLDKDAEG